MSENKTEKDKDMLVVTSDGVGEKRYSSDGLIKNGMDEILAPMKVSVRYVGMKYLPPLTIYHAIDVSSGR